MAKTAPKTPTLDTSNFVPSLFILTFLLVGFIPNLQAVDKIAPQWLYLSFVNLLCGAYLFYKRSSYTERFQVVLTNFMSLFYIGFVAWGAISYFYAVNSTEVLVNIVRHFNTLFMFLHLAILLYNIKDKNNLLSVAITLILAIEAYAVLNEALTMYKAGGIQSGALKGVTANRNITAFSIAIKIPYVLYLVLNNKKLIFKLFNTTLIFLSLFSLSMIQSRASFIAAALIAVAVLFWTLLQFKKERNIQSLTPNLFYLLPLILALTVNQIFISDKGADALSRASTISLSTNDGSVNQRLRYYADVAAHIASNPILGVGLGNWKLVSIDYDKENIKGYVVPYHAHSDFIQLGAELGVIGFLLYLGAFICAIYFAFIILFRSELEQDNKLFVFLLLTSLGVYLVDANLNFPIARPQVLAPWALTMSLICYYYLQARKPKTPAKVSKAFSLFPLTAIILMLPSISITHSTFESHKGQMFLLRDFNSSKFTVAMDKVDHVTPDIPNITVTALPMKSIKARYYFENKKYDKALSLLNQGTSANPYVFYSENLKAQIFMKLGKIDSAFVNAKKAYFGLPNNMLHASVFAQTLNLKRDLTEVKEALKVLSTNAKKEIWLNFLIVYSGLKPSGDQDLIKYLDKMIQKYPSDKNFNSLKRNIVIGQLKINEAITISQAGLTFFNTQRYVEAGMEYEKASKLDSLDYSHFENAASAYYMAGDYGKSLLMSDKVISRFQPQTGKSEYLKALVLLNYGDKTRSCELLNAAQDFGYKQAEPLLEQHCK
jgi:O-antigen ligase